MNRTYFNIYEIMSCAYNITNEPFEMQALGAKTFLNFINIGIEGQSATDTLITSTYAATIATLWSKYIYPEYFRDNILYIDNFVFENETSWTANDKNNIKSAFAKELSGSLFVWLLSTTNKYGLLISNYEAQKTHLLDQIKSNNKTIFQDTPQSTLSTYDETHTSNRTVNTTESDPGTMISRLNEIEDNLKMLYKEWSDDFGKTFIIWSV